MMIIGLELALQGQEYNDGLNGMPSMRVGGRREIALPPKLAWGKKGLPGKISPNMWFFFTIEVIDLLK